MTLERMARVIDCYGRYNIGNGQMCNKVETIQYLLQRGEGGDKFYSGCKLFYCPVLAELCLSIALRDDNTGDK